MSNAKLFRLVAISMIAYFSVLPDHGAGAVTACAIRWDAWYSNGNTDPAHYTAETLSPPQWHRLAPVHARFDSAGRITWEPSQASFDAEIRAAHGANLCWAYLMYGKNNVIDLSHPMMRGLAFHRSSINRADVNYALMTTSGLLGRADQYQLAVNATIDLMRDGNYQKVFIHGTSRPVLFLFYDPTDLRTLFGGNLAKMKEAIDSFRRRSEEQNLGNPYIVLILSGAREAESVRSGLGADAISQYIAGRRKRGIQSWADFEPSIVADWNAYAVATTADVVPTLRSGADIRARCQTPPPFDHRFTKGNACDNFVVNPTVAQLKAEFEDSALWIKSHEKTDPAHLLLIYAWSECDESGNCLMPTIGDPNGQKLKAISEIIRH